MAGDAVLAVELQSRLLRGAALKGERTARVKTAA
jgi:hypothetical protein